MAFSSSVKSAVTTGALAAGLLIGEIPIPGQQRACVERVPVIACEDVPGRYSSDPYGNRSVPKRCVELVPRADGGPGYALVFTHNDRYSNHLTDRTNWMGRPEVRTVLYQGFADDRGKLLGFRTTLPAFSQKAAERERRDERYIGMIAQRLTYRALRQRRE